MATPDPPARIEKCVDQPSAYAGEQTSATVVKIHSTPANDTARLVIRNPPESLRLEYGVNSGVEFTNLKGFTRTFGGSGVIVQSNQSRVAVTVSILKNRQITTPPTAETNTLIRLPRVSHPVQFSVAGTGYVGDQFAILGPYSDASRTVGCQELRVIVPDSAETVPRVSASSIVGDLATAAREIAIGHRSEVVTAFVGPGSMDGVSGFVPRHYDTRNGGNEMILDPDMQGPQTSKLVYHEYVHTRQRNLSPRWVAEGQAEFLAAELLIQSGRAPPRYVDAIQTQQLLNQTSGTVRTDGRREPYARGYYFFLNMDHRLAETNTSTEIVMRQVNSRQHTPANAGTKQTWAHAVQTVSGERVQLTHPYEGAQSGRYWITTQPANPTLRLALGMLGTPIFRPIALLVLVGWLSLELWDRASVEENDL